MDISIIRAKCKQERLTIAELERILGLSNGAIGKWKYGSPRINSIKRVADYFHCTIDELIAEKDS